MMPVLLLICVENGVWLVNHQRWYRDQEELKP